MTIILMNVNLVKFLRLHKDIYLCVRAVRVRGVTDYSTTYGRAVSVVGAPGRYVFDRKEIHQTITPSPPR